MENGREKKKVIRIIKVDWVKRKDGVKENRASRPRGLTRPERILDDIAVEALENLRQVITLAKTRFSLPRVAA